MRQFELTVLFSAIIVIFVIFGTKIVLKNKKAVEAIKNCIWLHPNAISTERFLFAMLSLWIFVYTKNYVASILLFVFAVVLDYVDGAIARACEKITEEGKFFDPLFDKLTYLPFFGIFVYFGEASVYLVLLLVGVDLLLGQLTFRLWAIRQGHSTAAVLMGKIKAVICFSVIFLMMIRKIHVSDGIKIILEEGAKLVNEALILCIVFAILSILAKLWASRKPA